MGPDLMTEPDLRTPEDARAVRPALRGLTAAGLVVDAVVHLRLATGYQLAAPGDIGQGNLFRIQAGLAILLTLGILIRATTVVTAAAFVTAASALSAVLLYRYVDVPALGPLPSMYEPVWFTQKALSAVAEALAAATALTLLLRQPRHQAAPVRKPPGR